MRGKFRLRRLDLPVIAAVLLLALLFFLLPKWLPDRAEGRRFTVEVSGHTVADHSLCEPGVYSVQAGENTLILTVSDGAVFVSDSDCPDGVCRRMGAISRAGETIICLPAGVCIRVVGEGEVDGYAG